MSQTHYLLYGDPFPDVMLMRIHGIEPDEAETLRDALEHEYMEREPFQHTFTIITEDGTPPAERLHLRKRGADVAREAAELRRRADAGPITTREARWLSAYESACAYIDQLNELRAEEHADNPPDLSALADELDTMAEHAAPPHRLNELMQQWGPQPITHGAPPASPPMPYSQLEDPQDAGEPEPEPQQAAGEPEGEPAPHEPHGDPEASGQADELSGEAKALALLVEHPDWTDTDIARVAGVNRTSLYRWEQFRAARAALRQGRGEHPRGSYDARTGELDAHDGDGAGL